MNSFNIDFIGAGFSRCGTTWIAKCLEDHPEICFSSKKECHFFDNDFEFERGIERYKKYFEHCGGEKIKGEFTPEYYYKEEYIKRIKDTFPDVKIIFSLRNPMERAFSHYLYRKRKTGKPKKLQDIFKYERECESRGELSAQVIRPGFYHKHLIPLVKYFGKEKVLIVIHDDHKKDPKKFMSNIYSFLGVEPNFISPNLVKPINTSRAVKYKIPHIKWLYAKRRKIAKYKLGYYFLEFLKAIRLNKVMGKILSWNIKRDGQTKEVENFDEDVREELRKIYKEDIAELEKYIGRDLSFWK